MIMKNNNTLQKFICLGFSLCLLSACTEPGETTYVGSATGGVLGAGLGAIIGNQTGDAGAGLAIGAVAGAGAGAAIGNALEAQQKSIRTQDEALERQQKILAAQNAEIQDLRGTSTDLPGRHSRAMPVITGSTTDARGSLSRDSSFTEQLNTGADSAYARNTVSMNAARDRSQAVAAQTVNSDNMNESSSMNDKVQAAKSDTLKEVDLSEVARGETAPAARMATTDSSESAECQKAQTESQKAESATEGADKLFYLRRAIRLCPSKAVYHKNLADQYLSLGRNEDAKTAYEDAVRLDPSLKEASQAMSAISSNNVY